jgi:ParB family chromosome partitioning protein
MVGPRRNRTPIGGSLLLTPNPPKQYNLPMVDTRPCPTPSIEQLRLEQIFTSPHQMRKHFDTALLKELAKSMKQEGLIQPITVRKVGNAYELVVGERRLRAAQILGWEAIDARVIDISDEDAAVKGLIENLQRADLTPIEEARGYKQLVEAPYNLTQEAIAQRVGKSQTAIARSLALLELPQEIQEIMPRGIITEAHTRSLRKISDRTRQIELALKGDREGWTVKELERRVNEALKQAGQPLTRREVKSRPPSQDPLAKIWQPILESANEAGVKVSAVRYEATGKWMLHIEAKNVSNPRRALADFFIQLGHTLNGPIPSELIESLQ